MNRYLAKSRTAPDCVLVVCRNTRPGKVDRDTNRRYGETSASETVQLDADRKWWPIHPIHRPHLKGIVYVVDGTIARIRGIDPNGRWHDDDRFMDNFKGERPPIVYFSIDGSSPEACDAIRGRGTFDKLIPNIRRSQELGYMGYGIMSVNDQNAHDVVPTLRLCNDLGLEHVNVHFVTNRGYATEESVITFERWEEIRREIEVASRGMRVTTRADHSLAKFGEYSGYCSVRAEDNLMIYPDGRVFICAMFFDLPGAHAFEWHDGRLHRNQRGRTELTTSDRFEATPEQRRLWFVDVHDGGGRAYVVPLAWRISGRLDVDALAAAVDALVPMIPDRVMDLGTGAVDTEVDYGLLAPVEPVHEPGEAVQPIGDHPGAQTRCLDVVHEPLHPSVDCRFPTGQGDLLRSHCEHASTSLVSSSNGKVRFELRCSPRKQWMHLRLHLYDT
jgi:hypothetical protein